MAKKASLSQLTSATHKGRPTKTGVAAPPIAMAAGVRGTQIRGADPRLTAAALTRISPTPKGPETYWPYGISGKSGS
jgi:hypothetical protein